MKKQINFLNNLKKRVVLAALLFIGIQLNAQVAVWHFTGNVDATPATYNGTAVGTPTYTSNALTLNGTNQYVTTPNVVNPASTAFTATAWVKYTGAAGFPNTPTILQQGDLNGNGRGWLWVNPTDSKLGSSIGNYPFCFIQKNSFFFLTFTCI